MKKEPLTQSQYNVLRYIEDFILKNGYPPTRSEIARGMQFGSANSAQQHIKRIEEKGYIEISPGVSRGIRIVDNLGVL